MKIKKMEEEAACALCINGNWQFLAGTSFNNYYFFSFLNYFGQQRQVS